MLTFLFASLKGERDVINRNGAFRRRGSDALEYDLIDIVRGDGYLRVLPHRANGTYNVPHFLEKRLFLPKRDFEGDVTT